MHLNYLFIISIQICLISIGRF